MPTRPAGGRGEGQLFEQQPTDYDEPGAQVRKIKIDDTARSSAGMAPRLGMPRTTKSIREVKGARSHRRCYALAVWAKRKE